MLDLDEITEDIGLGRFQILQQLLVSGVRLADGAEILISSAVLSILSQEWHLSPALKGSMMSIIFIGVFFGNLIGGSVADLYGRRAAVIISYVGLILFGLCSACSEGPMSMLSARFFFGIFYGFGMGPSVTLQVESCPKAFRGHMVNVNNCFFTLGEIFAAWLLWAFMKDLNQNAAEQDNWRYVTALAISPAFLILPFTVLLLYESPHFLVVKGRHEEAVGVVRSMAVQNGQPQAIAHLQDGSGNQGSEEYQPSARQRLLLPQATGRQGEASRTTKGMVDVLLRSEFRSIIIGGVYICFLANFLFFGLTYAMPQVFRVMKTPFSPASEVLVVTSADIPGCLLAGVLIRSKNYGHRDSLGALSFVLALLLPSLIILECSETVSMVSVSLYSAYLSKCAVTAFFTISYVYITEIFPSAYRCTAAGACMAGGRLGSVLAPVAFEMFCMRGYGKKTESHIPFWILSSTLCLAGIVVINRCLTFELKGEPLEDIEYRLGGEFGVKRPALQAAQKESGNRDLLPLWRSRQATSAEEIPWKRGDAPQAG